MMKLGGDGGRGGELTVFRPSFFDRRFLTVGGTDGQNGKYFLLRTTHQRNKIWRRRIRNVMAAFYLNHLSCNELRFVGG